MEEKALNEKESLELISQMIRNTQNRIEVGAGRPFLVWGYVTVFISLAVWYMVFTTHNPVWYKLWFALPLLGVLLTFLLCRNPVPGVKTYIDRVINYVWCVCGIAGFFISFVSMFIAHFPVLFIVVLLMGIGTTLTGLIIRFKPLAIAGIVGILLQTVMCIFVAGINQILVFASIFVIMMIIPGHILNYYCKKHAK